MGIIHVERRGRSTRFDEHGANKIDDGRFLATAPRNGHHLGYQPQRFRIADASGLYRFCRALRRHGFITPNCRPVERKDEPATTGCSGCTPGQRVHLTGFEILITGPAMHNIAAYSAVRADFAAL